MGAHWSLTFRRGGEKRHWFKMAACLCGPVTFCRAAGGGRGALKCRVRLVNEHNDCIPLSLSLFFLLLLLGGSTTPRTLLPLRSISALYVLFI